jgi:tetratricopeptide (TPR) repeat protein
MSLEVPKSNFLDVDYLIQASIPQRRLAWPKLLAGGLIAGILISWMMQHSDTGGDNLFSAFLVLSFAGFVATNVYQGIATSRMARAEQATLMEIEEMIQLRQWPRVAMAVEFFLSRPTFSPVARAQGLLFLATTLTRYHRFEDAVKVFDHLLETIPLDDSATNIVRLSRAMALLREDALLDADRAIAELRRSNRGSEPAGLSLVEIYRDVKTGHPAEAIEMFEKRLPIMRTELGHRVADAWALAARAYDLLGKTVEAAKAFENATLLAPLGELCRRYPEVSVLTQRYAPAAAPPEVA